MTGKRFTATVLCAALLVALLAAAATASAPAEESQFVSKINAERVERRLATLSVKDDLVAVARRHSARMAAAGRIFHNDNLPNEVDGWTVLGENVGVGPTVASLHDAFMQSPGHRANIVEDEYNQVGIGVVVTADGTIYVTEIFARRSAPQKASREIKTTRNVGEGASTSGGSTKTSRPRRTASRPQPAPAARRSTAQAKPAPATASAPAAVPVAERNVAHLRRLLALDAPA